MSQQDDSNLDFVAGSTQLRSFFNHRGEKRTGTWSKYTLYGRENV